MVRLNFLLTAVKFQHSIDEMIGKAMISANMNGEIGYQDKQTIILYSPKESEKRMNEYLQIKHQADQQDEEVEEGSANQQEEKVEAPAQEEQKQEEKPKRKTKQQQLKIKLD